MFVVFSGAIGIYILAKKEDGTSKLNMVTQIMPYDVIGELSLLYGHKRSATAMSTEDSELIVLEKEAFHKAMEVKEFFFAKRITQYLLGKWYYDTSWRSY